ncbi:MAG TPA: adenylyltransferase/cytidyltransferase family protein [Candidatus Saccharimonadales bacterium]|nr:adenylyltransferase/cytidyltransferase family protein [Candidatus Saccharimonadales bacterium]
MMAAIHSLDELSRLRPTLKNVVLLGGVFDILHAGHIAHLKEAKAQGDTLIVHVTSDKRVRQKKGSQRPIVSEQERAQIIAAIRYVDYVFIGDLPHYTRQTLEALAPDVLFLNYEAVNPAVNEHLDSVGARTKVIVSNTPKTISTTGIVSKIQALKTPS